MNPFAGSWSGTWNISRIENHFGTFDWTISDSGQIRGRVNIADRSGDVKGHVGEDGKLKFIGFAPSDEPSDGASGRPFLGTAEIDDGHLLISAQGLFNGVVGHVDDWLVGILQKE